MPEPVIRTDGLTKHFGQTKAVDEISFHVERGQVFGFLGPNGSGKTTTIGMLLGIVTPPRGRFELFGNGTTAGIHAARQRIGATLEYPNFYPYLSCRDNLELVARVKGKGAPAVAEALEVVGLVKRQKTKFKACSLGMKQRLALAATMLGDPELIILDEPANGLDPEGMREIRHIIGELADRGKTIFLSSHLMWEVQRTCTHLAIVREGRLVRQASVAEITQDAVVVELRSDSLDALRSAVAGYAGASKAWLDGDRVLAHLTDPDLSSLNRFLGDRDIYVSHLARETRSLEHVFLELTGATAVGFGEVA
jgi:ABC-type multidrug transport system ATPase subunit